VRRQRTAKDGVLLVDQAGRRGLGDRDERQLVGHFEHRKVALGRRIEHRLGHRVVAEARPEAEPGELVVRQPGDELALARGAVELHPRGQKQLGARQPRRRVKQLRDVHPPHPSIEARFAGQHGEIEFAD
jgi:hypothetical protein